MTDPESDHASDEQHEAGRVPRLHCLKHPVATVEKGSQSSRYDRGCAETDHDHSGENVEFLVVRHFVTQFFILFCRSNYLYYT